MCEKANSADFNSSGLTCAQARTGETSGTKSALAVRGGGLTDPLLFVSINVKSSFQACCDATKCEQAALSAASTPFAGTYQSLRELVHLLVERVLLQQNLWEVT